MDNMLSKVLRIMRTEKKISQKDMADYLNVDRTTYTKYESGDSSPDYGKLIKLAGYFNVSVDDLLGRGTRFDTGWIIKEEREHQGMAVEELAEQLGLDTETMERFEDDELPISNYFFEKIAKIFGMSSVEFLQKYDLYDEYIPKEFDGDANRYEQFKIVSEADAVKDPGYEAPTTIAAHHDNEDWTEEELKEIARFKEFVRSKRGQNRE